MNRRRWLIQVAVVSLTIVAVTLACGGKEDAKGVSDLQEQWWFLSGYAFDCADDEEMIAVFQMLLLVQGSIPASVSAEVQAWLEGSSTKQNVRGVLLSYLRASVTFDGLLSFLLGEWVSNLEDAVLDMMRGVREDKNHLFVSGISDAHALAVQALLFIDLMVSSAPPSVLQWLESIAERGNAVDVPGLILGTANAETISRSMLGFLDDCKAIKSLYGL